MRRSQCRHWSHACSYRWAAACSLALAFAAGCASRAERSAFDDWRRVNRDVYGGKHDDLTHADLNHSAGDAVPPASASLDENATIDDYLAYAALHNPGLEAAFNEWKAALERIPQARGLPDPRFNYRFFIQNVETRVGPQRQAFGISQMFPWFGKLELAGDMATEGARAAQARYDARKLALFYDVKKAYYEYYYLARTIGVVEENHRLMKYLEGVARTRFKAAAAQHPDVIRAQVELGKLDDQLRSLRDLRSSVAARLNASLGRPLDEVIPWPKSIPEAVGRLDRDALDRSLRQKNPELLALQHEIARRRLGINLARKNREPDVTIGIDYIDTDKRNDASPPDNGQDAVAAGFSINVPIWSEKNEAAVSEAFAQFGSATKTRVDRQNMLGASLRTAIYHYEDAVRKIDLFRDTLVPKAKEGIKATEASFRAGQSSFIDLVDAQRALLQFQLSFERALTDGATRLAEVEMLVGDQVEPIIAPAVEQPPANPINPDEPQQGDNDGK